MSVTTGGQSVTYDQVRHVISQPPDRRQDFQITNIVSWFRGIKHTKVLGQLKPGNTSSQRVIV